MVPVDVGKKYRNYFLQDVVMRKMEKVFSKVPQGERNRGLLPLELLREVLGSDSDPFPPSRGGISRVSPARGGEGSSPDLPFPDFAPPFFCRSLGEETWGG